MKSELKVASVVILYNPALEVLKNIIACTEQTEIVFVLDNSDSYNQTLIDKINNIDKVEYHNFNSNLGVAYALNFAANLAIKNNFDFLLTMDQDSEATSNFVKKLIEVHRNYKSVGIAAPYPQNRIHKILPPDNSIHQINKVITSGALLNLRAYIEVGPFMEELFIDYVDFEYCFRLQRNNYSIYINNDAIIYH
ncbi:MAG: glycosyltransferase, partial [Ignavibacteria bacterium]|nr:glycosyltransferase [Ignavibacteria bacterium]